MFLGLVFTIISAVALLVRADTAFLLPPPAGINVTAGSQVNITWTMDWGLIPISLEVYQQDDATTEGWVSSTLLTGALNPGSYTWRAEPLDNLPTTFPQYGFHFALSNSTGTINSGALFIVDNVSTSSSVTTSTSSSVTTSASSVPATSSTTQAANQTSTPSAANPTSSTTTGTPSSQPSSPAKGGLSPGAKAGIAVAAVLGSGLFGILGFWIMTSRRKQKSKGELDAQELPAHGRMEKLHTDPTELDVDAMRVEAGGDPRAEVYGDSRAELE